MISENDKILVIHTEMIPLKTTKNTQGIQVMKFKKNTWLKSMNRAQEMALANYQIYRVKNIPSSGSFAKEEDASVQQLSLL